MCITTDSKRKPYGYLFKNEQNLFIYGCSQCNQEFCVGTELEQHTNVHDLKQEQEIQPKESTSDYDIKPFSICEVDLHESEPEPSIANTLFLTEEPKPEQTPVENTNECNDNDTIPEFEDFKDDSSSESSAEEFVIKTRKKPKPQSVKIEKKTPTKKSRPKKPKEKLELLCDICCRVFTSIARVRQHMKSTHITKTPKVYRPQTPTLCTLCGKNIRCMKSHMKICHTTERPFKCDFCEATFKQKAHRDNHLRQHTGEKPFICFKCGKSYCSQSAMNGHIKRYHYRLKPHKCDQCGRTYRDLYELRDHINLHHLNQKLHICSVCQRAFGTRKHMHQHMLSHGEKRFQCKFCELKFATTSGRRGHEIRTHGAI